MTTRSEGKKVTPKPGGAKGSVTAGHIPGQGKLDPLVEIYDTRGVRLNAMTLPGNPDGEGGGLRGNVTSCSKGAMGRMRNFMLTRYVPGDHLCVGTTFTIPGPVMAADSARRIFGTWARSTQKKGWPTIWRAETQKRGQLHWHCLVHVPREQVRLRDGFGCFKLMECPSSDECQELEEFPDGTFDHPSKPTLAHFYRYCAVGAVTQSWHRALDSLGNVRFDPPFISNGEMYERLPLMLLPGAERESAACKCDADPSSRWMHYLQDHASKKKQEQEGTWKGRRWGKICGAKFKVLEPSEIVELTRKQYQRFKRCRQRLSTPSIRDERCVFGSRLGYRNQRGSRGASVWFSNTETNRRLCTWAQSFDDGPPVKMFDPSRFGVKK